MLLQWRLYFTMAVLCSLANSCENDEQCEAHQVCCGKRCKSWPKCFLNTDKECFYDTHCVKGAICVSNVCKAKSLPPRLCQNHDDCVLQKHSKAYDLKFNTSRCCSGKCFKTKSCLTLRVINTTIIATNTPLQWSCWSDTNCREGFECIDGKCIEKDSPLDSSQNRQELKDRSLSRAGFLSAAILTSAVFLVVMCFCFLKETKYVRRHIERSQARESLTQNTCSQHIYQQEEQRNSTVQSSPWMLFPGLYGYGHTERDNNQQGDCNTSCSAPPSYRSVCFEHELPPSYDEAVNTRI